MFILLAGCADHSPPKADETKVKQFAGRGYLTDDQFGIETTFATWINGSNSFNVALTVPTKPGAFPLIVYLPALGEARTAGEGWRTAWAKGGYAVISIQPLGEDAAAWSSPQARTGDFSGLARERYSGKVMTVRVDSLRSALAELLLRNGRKEAPLDRVDLSRVALAGYDLGAYTAMAIIGEHIKDAAPSALPIAVGAVIALSPYADFSGASFSTRYRDIRSPVLSITSNADTDALGLVTSPGVRKAPFENMPAGNKYLLSLFDFPHGALSGGEIKRAAEADRSSEKSHRDTTHAQDGGRSGSRRKGGGKTDGAGDLSDQGTNDRSALRGGPQLSPTALAMDETIIKDVTTAFLDAYLKSDPMAREWLDKDSFRWIKDHGELKKK